MARKQSSDSVSRLAARVLAGKDATREEVLILAASVLSQDEVRGMRGKKTVRCSKR